MYIVRYIKKGFQRHRAKSLSSRVLPTGHDPVTP